MTTHLSVGTNSFLLSRVPTKQFNQYHIEYQSRKPLKRHEQIQYFHHLQNVVKPDLFRPRIVYDGAAIGYCASRLNFNGGTSASLTISLASDQLVPEGRGITIIISLASAEPIDLCHIQDLYSSTGGHGQMTSRAQVAINLVQNIVRQWPNMHLNHPSNGRAYFPQQNAQKSIGGGLVLRRGLFQSVRPSNIRGSLALQIDTCTAVVYSDSALPSVCMEFLGGKDVRVLRLTENDFDFKRMEKFLKKVKVTYTIPQGDGRGSNKTKMIHGLVACAGDFGFLKDDQEITVAQHYRRAYGYTVKYRDIIGVRFSPRDAERPVVVPLELCKIAPGQFFKKKIPDSLIPEVVKFATMRPQDKKTAIMTAIGLYTRGEFLQENDIHVEASPIVARAKRLQAPPILYGDNKQVHAERGGWNVLKKKFKEPRPMQNWGVINFQPGGMPPKVFKQKINTLIDCCASLGVAAPENPDFGIDGNAQNPRAALNDAISMLRRRHPTGPPAFLVVFIILPDNSAQLKQTVKQWGDIQNGFITQCMRFTKLNAQGNLSQYFNNVALKVNARLGGVNSDVQSDALRDAMVGKSGREVTIIMGVDASHPGPGVQKPTTTSLVYSINAEATKYSALMGIQNPRTEMIEDLENFVYHAVMAVGRKAAKSPTRIICFRDGVSEGEYDKVRQVELAAMDRAVDRLWEKMGLKESESPKPKITFIVVGKRHHAVFFPTNPADADNKGNCQPGTVVDQDVTQPTECDFYLQSHSAIQGTVRPAHYIVLRDQIFNFNVQQIQEVAFALCHVYAKATRSVSIPAPVYYADLVCSRGAIHINPASRLMFNDGGSSTSSSDDTINMDLWKAAFQPAAHGRLREGMYFL